MCTPPTTEKTGYIVIANVAGAIAARNSHKVFESGALPDPASIGDISPICEGIAGYPSKAHPRTTGD